MAKAEMELRKLKFQKLKLQKLKGIFSIKHKGDSIGESFGGPKEEY